MNKEKEILKKERKEYIKSQRKKFWKSPRDFLIKPTIEYWKEDPKGAIKVFLKGLIIYYLIFAGIQAINNDFIYCDSSIDEFDGKIIYVYNDFVKYYNEKAMEMQSNYNPNPMNQEIMVKDFNKEYKMICEYNWNKWKKNGFVNNMKDMMKGMFIITFKL